jgi:hypothetical protein
MLGEIKIQKRHLIPIQGEKSGKRDAEEAFDSRSKLKKAAKLVGSFAAFSIIFLR